MGGGDKYMTYCTQHIDNTPRSNWTTSLASLPSTIDSNYKIEHPVPTEGGREIRHCLAYGGQSQFLHFQPKNKDYPKNEPNLRNEPKMWHSRPRLWSFSSSRRDIQTFAISLLPFCQNKPISPLWLRCPLWQEMQNKPNLNIFLIITKEGNYETKPF